MEIVASKISIAFPAFLTQNPIAEVPIRRPCFPVMLGYSAQQWRERARIPFCSIGTRFSITVQAISSGVKDVELSSSRFEDFSVSTSGTNITTELKISVEVSGGKTQEIFDNELSKIAADAQPIPGFRRVKGGKTPDVQRDVLLQILGPSKVYQQVIKKIINSAIAQYVQKEGLNVSKDLRIEQSFEELEANFEPGDHFNFDAVVQLQDLN